MLVHVSDLFLICSCPEFWLLVRAEAVQHTGARAMPGHAWVMPGHAGAVPGDASTMLESIHHAGAMLGHLGVMLGPDWSMLRRNGAILGHSKP